MRTFRIFKNELNEPVRYTLINSWDEVFSFDANPSIGYNEFKGTFRRFKSKSTKPFGTLIGFDELTPDAQEFVKDRI